MRRQLSLCFSFSLLITASAVAQKASPEPDEPSVGKHLFILSGQSNMQGLKPEESFIPTVDQQYGKGKSIVVFDALGGQPIRRWHKAWKSGPNKQSQAPKGKKLVLGDLYDRLMTKVRAAIKNQQVETVTFLWMQGERDAREQFGDVYATSLQGVLDQLARDLNRKDIRIVIGRLSDFDMKNSRYKHWTKLREVQVKFAESHPRAAWVNTDDLNDGTNRRGKPIKDDLHYSAVGYKVFGKRMAMAARYLHTRGRISSGDGTWGIPVPAEKK